MTLVTQSDDGINNTTGVSLVVLYNYILVCDWLQTVVSRSVMNHLHFKVKAAFNYSNSQIDSTTFLCSSRRSNIIIYLFTQILL